MSPLPHPLADVQFVSLTTFRKNGEPVSTPIWLAGDGDALVITTGASSGKVKRLRRDPRVEMRPCSRRGQVSPDAPVSHGTATVVDDPDAQRRLVEPIRRKYGIEYRIVMTVEKIMRRGQTDRVILRIVSSDANRMEPVT